MIESPPLLTIRRRFKRPTKTTLAAFANLPISMIADAQRGKGGLDHRMVPLESTYSFVGPAITAWCGAGDNLAALAALELAQQGDIIVIACDGFDGVGVIGDRFAGMARNKRIGGIVVDGLVRDRPGIREAGVACYARGTNASSAYSIGPGEVGLPIAIGGVTVESGDIVVGDCEGTVVVPQSTVAAVIDALKKVKANEIRLNREVAEGAAGFKFVSELLKSDKTRYLD